MKNPLWSVVHGLIAVAVASLTLTALAIRADAGTPAVVKPAVNAPVTVTDNGETWTLDNGILNVTIHKKTGDLLSIIYHNVETLRPSIWLVPDTYHSPPTPAGTTNPSWQQTPTGTVTASVTIDPAKNGGERGEVAVKGVNSGKMDIELRYALERGVSGFYTYAQFSHPASYPNASEPESQFVVQLDPTFNWFSVDADRNTLAPTTQDLRSGVVIHAKEQKILSRASTRTPSSTNTATAPSSTGFRPGGFPAPRTTWGSISSIRAPSISAAAPRRWI